MPTVDTINNLTLKNPGNKTHNIVSAFSGNKIHYNSDFCLWILFPVDAMDGQKLLSI